MAGKQTFFWFRRDLRMEDNHGLWQALKNSDVQPIFIFDEDILEDLPNDDPRVQFIYERLENIHKILQKHNSSLLCLKGKPLEIWEDLLRNQKINAVYTNHDYEPYAIYRDQKVADLCEQYGIGFYSFKDQVIFEKDEIVKADGNPYTVYTPYKNKWIEKFNEKGFELFEQMALENLSQSNHKFPSMEELGFHPSTLQVRPYRPEKRNRYAEKRDFPVVGTTNLGPHLRFGTLSIRKIIQDLGQDESVFLSELIWREFFMQILWHFPKVVTENFKPQYNGIQWRKDERDFKRWCEGQTGYPMVDAGMRELNQTGYMHNRVRMVVASFLCKHLLIDWRWGESYFAEKLLDYELASNNGNWQWAAGTGCDAAPYFRIFNPGEQIKKFDRDFQYIKKWVPEFQELTYVQPMVEHKFARERALEAYKIGISNS